MLTNAFRDIFSSKLTEATVQVGKLTTDEVEDYLDGKALLPVHVQPSLAGATPTRVMLLDRNGKELGHFPVMHVNMQSDYRGRTRLTIEIDVTPF